MSKKKIYFIYMPTPVLGRNPLQFFNGSGFFGRVFGIYTEDDYINKLSEYLKEHYPDWAVYRDDTESDIDLIIKKDVRLLICAPGLKYQFSHRGFSKEYIIYLGMMDYATVNIGPVIRKIKEMDNEKST
ncbi:MULTISPECIES: nitrogen fixation protein NifS [Pantoea]|jgi:hypothetical protein|uniref:nitrogen fixation protein NifS n=1 Tax=Pantoea TaxID=53335 RepID=UPI00197D975E|nr:MULTISPECIES: nitrogen fixation protein NifS [Pantoea]MDC7872106.1 hypothetical protein [Pantoea ananatis]WRH11906.1 nitrogen fixation protein NifS [Pantoea sp. JZ2]